jgi:TonB family protein
MDMYKIILRSFALCLLANLFAGAGLAVQASKLLPSQPRPATTVIPKYPPIARAACIQGPVTVVVEIDSTGKVVEADVLYGQALLWQTAADAARGWTFDAVKDGSGMRREVLRFVFRILPFEVPEKKLKAVWFSRTEVVIRTHPSEPSCTHCDEKRRRQLRRGGCPRQP